MLQPTGPPYWLSEGGSILAAVHGLHVQGVRVRQPRIAHVLFLSMSSGKEMSEPAQLLTIASRSADDGGVAGMV
jgi:hypothetical protein